MEDVLINLKKIKISVFFHVHLFIKIEFTKEFKDYPESFPLSSNLDLPAPKSNVHPSLNTFDRSAFTEGTIQDNNYLTPD